MSLLNQAIAGGLGTIRKIAGVTVTVTRGAQSSNPLNAGIGSTTYELDDGESIVETWTARDYLIAVADYQIPFGTPTLPQQGDVIAETVNGVAKTFAVLVPEGKQAFEFSDVGQTQLRVHTKEVT